MSESITDWLIQTNKGEHTSLAMLWDHFSPPLMRIIDQECQNLRTHDAEDIVSISFYNLIAEMLDGSKTEITNGRDFWRLLRVITKRRLQDAFRYEKAEIRGGSYTIVSLEPDTVLCKRQVTHCETFGGEELLDRLMEVAEQMDRPEFSRIIDYKVQGLSNAEVARTLGVSLRTVQYLIRDIKTKWLTTFE